MFRNLAGNLVLHGRIETTEAKAKELRRIADRLITKATRLGEDLTKDVSSLSDEERTNVLAKRLHAQRTVAKFLPRTGAVLSEDGETEEVDLIFKLFHEIAPKYMDRVSEGKGGGYTRTTRLLNRRGDVTHICEPGNRIPSNLAINSSVTQICRKCIQHTLGSHTGIGICCGGILSGAHSNC